MLIPGQIKEVLTARLVLIGRTVEIVRENLGEPMVHVIAGKF